MVRAAGRVARETGGRSQGVTLHGEAGAVLNADLSSKDMMVNAAHSVVTSFHFQSRLREDPLFSCIVSNTTRANAPHCRVHVHKCCSVTASTGQGATGTCCYTPQTQKDGVRWWLNRCRSHCRQGTAGTRARALKAGDWSRAAQLRRALRDTFPAEGWSRPGATRALGPSPMLPPQSSITAR